MPDISILVELSSFYDVDIREIIDGERKSEKMNEEVKETVLKVADYAEKEKELLLRRVRIINIVGLFALGIGISIGDSAVPFFATLCGMAYGVAVGAMLVTILYSLGVLTKIREEKSVRRMLRFYW